MSGDREKDAQVKKIGAVLVSIIPPSARVALGLAAQLYQHGVRIHPELADKPLRRTQMQEAVTPDVQKAAEAKAFATLREMAHQYPYLQPLVGKIENARTDEDRVALLNELRRKIPDELIAEATARADNLGDSP